MLNERMHSREFSLNKRKEQRELAQKRKKLAGVVVAIVLVGALSVGGTVAWLTAETSPVTNTFEVVTTTTGIEEEIDSSTKKNVKVSNPSTSDIPVYVRATYTVSWVKLDQVGNTVDTRIAASADEYTLVSSAADNGWILDSTTGVYYYKTPVQPGASTANLIDSVTPVENKAPDDGFILSVQIVSESIQAMPSDAVEDAWDAVGVDASGNLTLVGTGA